MKNVLLTLFLVISSNASIACMFPESGKYYDSLIKVTKGNKDHSFELEVPKRIKHSSSAEIYLGYSKIGHDGPRLLNYAHRLRYWFSGKTVKLKFKSPYKKGYEPYIHVRWPAQVCDIIANSKNLSEIE